MRNWFLKLLIFIIICSLLVKFVDGQYINIPSDLRKRGIYYWWCWGKCTFYLCNPNNFTTTSVYTFKLENGHTIQLIPLENKKNWYKIIVDNKFCGYLVPPENRPCPIAITDTIGLNLILANVKLENSDRVCQLLFDIGIIDPNSSSIKPSNPVPKPNYTSVTFVQSSNFSVIKYLYLSAQSEYFINYLQPIKCGRIVLKLKLDIKYNQSKAINKTYTCIEVYKLNVSEKDKEKVEKLLQKGKISLNELKDYNPELIYKKCNNEPIVSELPSSTTLKTSILSELKIYVNSGYVLFGECKEDNTYSCCKENVSSSGESYELMQPVPSNHILTFNVITPAKWKIIEPSELKNKYLSSINLTNLIEILQKTKSNSLVLQLEPNNTDLLKYEIIDVNCSKIKGKKIVLVNATIDLKNNRTYITFAWGFDSNKCEVKEYRTCIIEGAELPRANITINKSKTIITSKYGNETTIARLACGTIKYIFYNITRIMPEKNVSKIENCLVFEPKEIGGKCRDFRQCCEESSTISCEPWKICFSDSKYRLKIDKKNAVGIINVNSENIDKIIINLAGNNYSIYFSDGGVRECFSKNSSKTIQVQPNTELAQLQAILKHQKEKSPDVPVVITIDKCATITLENKTLYYHYLGSEGCPFNNLPKEDKTIPGAVCYATIGKPPGKTEDYYEIICGRPSAGKISVPEFIVAYNDKEIVVCAGVKCQSSKGNGEWIFLSSSNGWKKIEHNGSEVYTSGKINSQMPPSISNDICKKIDRSGELYAYYDGKSWWLALKLPSLDVAQYFISYGAATSIKKIGNNWYLIFDKAHIIDENGNDKILVLKKVSTSTGASILEFADPEEFVVRLEKEKNNLYKLKNVTIICDPNTQEWSIVFSNGIRLRLLSTFGPGQTIKYGKVIQVQSLGAKLPSQAKNGISINKKGNIVFGKPTAYLGAGRGAMLMGGGAAQFSFPFLVENIYELIAIIVFVAFIIIKVEKNEKNKNRRN